MSVKRANRFYGLGERLLCSVLCTVGREGSFITVITKKKSIEYSSPAIDVHVVSSGVRAAGLSPMHGRPHKDAGILCRPDVQGLSSRGVYTAPMQLVCCV